MTGIVVGIDGSEFSEQALVWAAREAELRHLPLRAVLAWDWLDQHHRTGPHTFEASYGEADALAALKGYVEQALGPLGASKIEHRVACDLPARALLEASKDADLLVVGARGLGGFRGLLLGSVSQQCLHHADCPIAIIRPDAGPPGAEHVERIVVGVDGSHAAVRALTWAVEEARIRRAALVVVHAWHVPAVAVSPFVGPTMDLALFEEEAHRVVDAALGGADTTGLAGPVERIVVSGGPASTLLETGKGADLIVVGSRGHGGFTGLILGSVSHHLAHHATSPLVVVPARA
jgi:nucleotide-binding universal stress UspA family protein